MSGGGVKVITDGCELRNPVSWQQVSDVFLSALLLFVPMRNGLP
jgi:hypothetical protein